MNKPDWKDCPEWVMWMAQDENGVWFGYDSKPDQLKNEWGRMGAGVFDNRGLCILLERGVESQKWNETLEARPSC